MKRSTAFVILSFAVALNGFGDSARSRAVSVALAHIDAWSHHNYQAARKSLAADVHVVAMRTQAGMATTDTIGADKYMEGLTRFAQGVVPGSAHVIKSIGDDRNALILLTVKAAFGPGAPKVTVTTARMYLLDEEGKIKVEHVIFYTTPD